MKLKELLQHPMLTLPKNWKSLGYSSYYTCVLEEGEKYIKLLGELDESELHGRYQFIGEISKESLISVSRSFLKMVCDTLQCYLEEGNPHKAYSILHNGLTQRYDSILLMSFLEFDYLYPANYRLRVKEGRAELGDLFHVPFESRHVVESCRYSIPGYPTLYLSNSVYLAYKELGDPDYDNLYVSKYRFTRSVNRVETLLDMRNTPPWGNCVGYQYKFLARWILVMACSIKVAHPKAPFKEEYILPQILLQWVKNNIYSGGRKTIGVCYSSTKIIDRDAGYYGHFYNTAIPILHSKKEGYCDTLSELFVMTKPIGFHEALKHSGEVSNQSQVKSIQVAGTAVEYIETDFGKIEQVLSEPCSELYYVNGNKVDGINT
ncbi:hypothetical protein [Bacteroides fragilis]|uniref:hypothetical protein n=1 Tax=Bacteroides fragilis TaxID=817 RepID=UPI00202DD137|nr:hypothetical protein [Bacteroides fragilis]MCM0373180.1 hypothetical protein [Bacteroides fragilis]